MRNFLLTLMVLIVSVTSCGTARYTTHGIVNTTDEVSYVLANYYPQLYEYYAEGVLSVNSVREVTAPDGGTDYRIRYKFVNYYYRNYNEKMAAVEQYFPELYQMYLNGVIEIGSVYKYVDKRTGEIRHHATLRYLNDVYYYNYYPDMRLFRYRRPIGPPPPRMRPAPRRDDRPGMRPPEPGRRDDRPETRPGDNPRPGNEPNVRPSNPPTRSPGGGQTTRPSNPPRTSAGESSSSRAGQARRR